MDKRGLKITTIPRKRVARSKVMTFNQEISDRYKKYLVPYKFGMGKNCISTLPQKYIGEGNMPSIIPPESELFSLSVDVTACLNHRYVTIIQTTSFKRTNSLPTLKQDTDVMLKMRRCPLKCCYNHGKISLM